MTCQGSLRGSTSQATTSARSNWATCLGISRLTVREALRHLQQEGLVTAGHRGMLRVNQLSAAEICGLYHVRAALEGLAVSTIIESPRRDDAVATLRDALDRLSDADSTFTDRVEPDLGSFPALRARRQPHARPELEAPRRPRIRVAIMSKDAEQLPGIMSRDRHAAIIDAIAAGNAASARAVPEDRMAVPRRSTPRPDASAAPDNAA